MKRVLLVVILLTLSQCFILGQDKAQSKPKDINGWTKASWGMTREEIMKAFPGAHAYKDVVVSAPFEIDRQKFTAEFGFGEPRLNQKATDPNSLTYLILAPAEESPSLDSLFQRLEVMLVAKYGEPTSRPDPAVQSSESVDVSIEWVFPSTRISLNRMKNGGPLPTDRLTISYVKNQAGKEPDNL